MKPNEIKKLEELLKDVESSEALTAVIPMRVYKERIRTILEQHREIERLREALKQILGWRELRDTNNIPIERIEDITREALTPPKGEGE